VRDPKERLAEIRKRADARIAADQKRNRAVWGTCMTLAMCLVIGLAIHRVSTAPPTPPLEPPTPTTVCVTTTAAVPTTVTHLTTTVSSVTTAPSSQTFSTTSTAQADTSPSPEPSETTTASQTVTERTTSRTATTKRPVTTTTVPTTVPSAQTTASSDVSSTTASTFPQDTTTKLPTVTTTQVSGESENGNNSTTVAASSAVTTSTTSDPIWNNATTQNSQWETTTTTALLSDAVIISVSSFEDVSVNDYITVKVTVSDNHYMVAGQINLVFDPDVLEPQSELQGVSPSILNGFYVSECRCPSDNEIQLTFSTPSTVGSTKSGTILEITFKVKRSLGDGTTVYCEIPEMISNRGNGNYNTPVFIQNGTITPAQTPGYDIWI